ncbi:MAG: hypothetical protein GXC72_11000 [Chitinophagaceae bacterium]|nr:hypothetical protein [Chitinophagaceae bacterium]
MLTKSQIDQLFVFCEKHRVLHYDLQVEIVDHLANAIEERMANTPSLDFDTALKQVHDGFGPLGLRNMTAGREQAMEKRYRFMKWQLFKSYFSLPKFAFTCLLLALVVSMPAFFRQDQLSWVLLVFFGLTALWYLRFHWAVYQRYRKQQRLPLLMTHSSYLYFSPALLAFGFQILNGALKYSGYAAEGLQMSMVQYYLCSIVCVFYILFAQIRWEMWHIVHQKAREMYPLAFAK